MVEELTIAEKRELKEAILNALKRNSKQLELYHSTQKNGEVDLVVNALEQTDITLRSAFNKLGLSEID